MKRMFVSLIVLCVLLQGCVALHYTNSKGVDAAGKDIKVKVVKVDEGKAGFKSSVDLWIFFPWRFKTESEVMMDYWE